MMDEESQLEAMLGKNEFALVERAVQSLGNGSCSLEITNKFAFELTLAFLQKKKPNSKLIDLRSTSLADAAAEMLAATGGSMDVQEMKPLPRPYGRGFSFSNAKKRLP